MKKIHYWNRIFNAYILGNKSHLTFWHGEPKINPSIDLQSLGPYYMSFKKKAEYDVDIDSNGIPMLNYQGVIGIQYNPIAIAQWGLGNFNLWYDHKSDIYFEKFINCADWLIENLEENKYGYKVWMHHFDFEYRDTLKAPWYSGLAQGQGISVLVRAFNHTKNKKYSRAASDAFQVFLVPIHEGGVNYVDSSGDHWIEEYIVNPPTHILNGFIWAMWGIYDYSNYMNKEIAKKLFKRYVNTLVSNLEQYDTGYWSLYEQAGLKMPMLASPFYHKLHIVQLKIMTKLTGITLFEQTAKKWSNYFNSGFNYYRALFVKSLFKIFHY
tara:strand:- start:64 stop:1035 length:972 start_codon:yes stop_codon:yes gene_type:complete